MSKLPKSMDLLEGFDVSEQDALFASHFIQAGNSADLLKKLVARESTLPLTMEKVKSTDFNLNMQRTELILTAVSELLGRAMDTHQVVTCDEVEGNDFYSTVLTGYSFRSKDGKNDLIYDCSTGEFSLANSEEWASEAASNFYSDCYDMDGVMGHNSSMSMN